MTRKERLQRSREHLLTRALNTPRGKMALSKAIGKAFISVAIEMGKRHALSN